VVAEALLAVVLVAAAMQAASAVEAATAVVDTGNSGNLSNKARLLRQTGLVFSYKSISSFSILHGIISLCATVEIRQQGKRVPPRTAGALLLHGSGSPRRSSFCDL
jgi:hypothetical protein